MQGSYNLKMEVAMPMSGSAMDCYEDMFKEITRKLYGEDGLPELGPNDRLPNTQSSIDYEVDNPVLKPEEHLTAFGLAALMQNGFPGSGILNSTFPQHKLTTTPPLEDKWVASEENLQWTQSKVATYNPVQKLFRCFECDCVGYLPRVTEHWLGTHSNLRTFQCSQCPYESAWARCVRMHLSRQHNINTDDGVDTVLKNNPVLQEITKYLQRLKTKLEENCTKPQQNSQILEDFQSTSNTTTRMPSQSVSNSSDHTSNPAKRYSCTYCPYATDRRDLFTRHENIHREEKPFQCYVCQKQFNRADHVKKHFLRMHREHPYDLNRIRRHPPKNASGLSYYQKYNSNSNNQSDTISSLANLHSLSIPSGFNNLNRNTPTTRPGNGDVKSPVSSNKGANLSKSNGKKKGEKRFTCCYCSWSGVDNWCLKRHMNTHLKPFICGLCDYKAARSERLATHVLKVHNKRACSKCSFLADDPVQLTAHQQEHHPLEQRHRSGHNVLRNATYNNSSVTSTCNQNQNTASSKSNELSLAAALLQQGNQLLQTEEKAWKSHTPKQHGAARLFNYMEASDGSDPECDSRQAEDMSRINLSHRIQSDFPEAGDAGSQVDEDEGEEMELPLFVCRSCGCEFEDDTSLETHQFAHRHSTASPAKSDDSKENVNPDLKYRCRLCNIVFENQPTVMIHMLSHSNLAPSTTAKNSSSSSRRKQSRPQKIVVPFWDNDEVEVLRHLNSKLRKWRRTPASSNVKISDKYMARLVTRRGFTCIWCKSSGLIRFHTRGSLALHHYWRHYRKYRFNCEHCDARFRHRYQAILHAGRVHSNRKVPTTKETAPPAVPVLLTQESHYFFSNPQTVTVPDSTSSAHKIGMSLFDHSFIHPTNPINGHMPIIIPTFPPN